MPPESQFEAHPFHVRNSRNTSSTYLEIQGYWYREASIYAHDEWCMAGILSGIILICSQLLPLCYSPYISFSLVCGICSYKCVWLETLLGTIVFLSDLFLCVVYRSEITHHDTAG